MVSEPSISASNSTMAASSSAMASSSTAPITSVNGFKYYVLFIDHFTRFTWIYLLQSKSEVLDKFVHFKNLVENQFSVKIKTFRSDGGGEYISTIFKSYLSQNDIIHQISCPYTPQQNGFVERKHRHLVETTITLLSQASISTSYWSYAVQTAVTLINLLPTCVLNFHSLGQSYIIPNLISRSSKSLVVLVIPISGPIPPIT